MPDHVVIAPKIVRSYRQRILADPARMFPLLCPAREVDWLAGWSFEMVHSVSGVAEPGCVFLTRQHGAGPTVWLTAEHAPPRRVRFVRVTPGEAVADIVIEVSPSDEGSDVDITYSLTGLPRGGKAAVAAFSQARWEAMMTFWEKAMNHYLATGEKLAAG